MSKTLDATESAHTTYCANVPSTVNPLNLALSQSAHGVNDQAKPKPRKKRTLLPSLAAVFTIETRIREPLDANTVPDLDRTIDRMVADSDDLADTLVAANQGGLRLERPVSKGGMQIRVADASAVKLDETFAGSKLCLSLDGVVVYYDHTAATLWDDCDFLGLWNGVKGHRKRGVERERHLGHI